MSGIDHDGRSIDASGQNPNGQEDGGSTPSHPHGSSVRSNDSAPGGSASHSDTPDHQDVLQFPGDSTPPGSSKSSSDSKSSSGSKSDASIVQPVPGDQTVISKKPQLSTKETAALPPQIDAIRLRPGDKLGHYELLEFVGGGGMGRVFRALDTKLDRHVAVKVLPCEQIADQETLQRFRNEAKSAARLDHDNIARAYDLGEDRGLSYLVFEFVEGDTIRDLVDQRGPMSLAEALSYTLQVADALTHAAARGIVHRDVKPSNILITSEGRAKLIDMGLARIQTPHDSEDDLTATGVTLGTFDYISPEQARDPRIVDVRSDIYSLGCTFFYMLTGRPPFPEGTVLQKLLQHQGDEPPEIHEFRPELPAEVSGVLRKFLAKDPNRRYQTADELVEQLQHLAEQVGLRPIGSSRRTWAASQPRRVPFFQRHLPWMAPVGALVLIWICLHVYWSYTAQRPLPHPQAASEQNTYPSGSDQFSPAAITPKHSAADSTSSTQKKAFDNILPKDPNKPVKPQNNSTEIPWLNPNTIAPWLATGGQEGDDPILVDSEPRGPKSSAPKSSAPKSSAPKSSAPKSSDLRSSDLRANNVTPGTKNSTTMTTPTGGEISSRANEIRSSDPLASKLSADGTSPGAPSGISAENSADPLSPMAAAVATSNGSSIAATTQLPPMPAGVLVVDLLGKRPNSYATLRAACNKATSGDIIELCYNGRQEERPLALHNLKLTIRAGKQFQPIIVFRPNDSDPSKYPRGMFNLTGTGLMLLNLTIELDVPRAIPAEEWSLFELGRSETLRLQQCSLTIRNAFDKRRAHHEDVAFFKIQAAAADASSADITKKNGTKKSAQIELTDCIVRGEAVLLRTEKLQPVQLSWDNGLFVSSEQLLRTEGGQKSPQPDDGIEIDLRHMTLVVDRGLCRIAGSRFASHQLPVTLNCTDSIVLCGDGQALVQQIGSARPGEMQKLFSYCGDRNCYPGFNTLWSIDDLDTPAVPDELLEWETWQSHWSPDHENHSLWCSVDWKNLPESSQPPHMRTPWDYMLDESEENPIRYAASDGNVVGFDIRQLPPLPLIPQGPENK